MSTTNRNGSTGLWRMALSGLCASLVGIGLARFAYTPLLPKLVAAQWFTSPQAAYLGAANLAGYLGGALLAQPAATRIPTVVILRAMMLTATAAFLACSVPLSFAWFFLWRLASGVAGGALMVLVAPTVLPHVPPFRRGLAAGCIFVGVGCGIVASGSLVPILLRWGLVPAWRGLAALALLLTAVAWNGWPEAGAGQTAAHRFRWPRNRVPATFYLEYALNAVGLVPHMILLVDFVAQGLGQGLDVGAWYWVLFGLGAMAGPVLAGNIADRIGFRRALRFGFLTQAMAVGLLVWDTSTLSLIVSSVVVGAFTPGVVALALGRVSELTLGDAGLQKSAWTLSTTAFAVGQAAGAYGFSYIFARTGGSYAVLFALGAAALALAFMIEVAKAGSDHRAIRASAWEPGVARRRQNG